MKVFRITLEPYSYRLHASGVVARWNSKGTLLIYTASSRALACLENVVHRSGEGLNQAFRTMIIEVPDGLPMSVVKPEELGTDWQNYQNQISTRAIGDQWVRKCETPVLQVPSAIIPEEHNYLINPNHPQFSQIQLVKTDPFSFDDRL